MTFVKKFVLFVSFLCLFFNVNGQRERYQQLLDRKNHLESQWPKLRDSLRTILNEQYINKNKEIYSYADLLKSKLINDSIEYYRLQNYPKIFYNRKKFELSNAIIGRKESISILDQKIISFYTHEYLVDAKAFVNPIWVDGIKLVKSDELHRFITNSREDYNNYHGRIKNNIENHIQMMISDSIDQYRHIKDSTYSAEISAFNKNVTLYDDEIEELKTKLEAKADRERLASLKRTYGSQNGQRIYNGEMWIGMTEQMLYSSWGYPSKVNKSVYPNYIRKQLVYPNHYVYTENGVVTSYQESY